MRPTTECFCGETLFSAFVNVVVCLSFLSKVLRIVPKHKCSSGNGNVLLEVVRRKVIVRMLLSWKIMHGLTKNLLLYIDLLSSKPFKQILIYCIHSCEFSNTILLNCESFSWVEIWLLCFDIYVYMYIYSCDLSGICLCGFICSLTCSVI